MWLYLDLIANILVAVACAWAVMSGRVNDGIFGKLVFIVLCFASISNAAWAYRHETDLDRAEVVSNIAVALVAVRCYWIKRHRAALRRWCRGCRDE